MLPNHVGKLTVARTAEASNGAIRVISSRETRGKGILSDVISRFSGAFEMRSSASGDMTGWVNTA